MVQHYWATANPCKVTKVHELKSLTNAAYQASFTAKNVIAGMLILVFGHSQDLTAVTRILSHHLLRLWKKELSNQEISIPSASGKFLGLTKIAFHQKKCVQSQNLDKCVTEDKGRR